MKVAGKQRGTQERAGAQKTEYTPLGGELTMQCISVQVFNMYGVNFEFGGLYDDAAFHSWRDEVVRKTCFRCRRRKQCSTNVSCQPSLCASIRVSYTPSGVYLPCCHIGSLVGCTLATGFAHNRTT